MCGIWAYICKYNQTIPTIYNVDKTQIIDYSVYHDIPRVRGPDRTNEIYTDSYHLVFHRLAINDLSEDGDQPFVFESYNTKYMYYIICNGEIYNYKQIIKDFNITTRSKSDCEVLCYLFETYWNTPAIIANILDGEYSIVALRINPNGERSVIAIRDPFGVRPLYWSQLPSGALVFSSMLGGISGICNTYDTISDHFPPGHYVKVDMSMHSNAYAIPVAFYDVAASICYSDNSDSDISYISDTSTDNNYEALRSYYYKNISGALVNAVAKRLESTDREVGFFLSGGLDSSLIVGIAARILHIKRPRTFSIGMVGSPDLQYAREVAEFLDTDHTEVHFTTQEAIDVINEVIECLETYDITTIRASIPSYLLAKYIRKHTNIKVILNGDGSDEVSCGYLYNYNAPDAESAHADAISLLKNIHKYDGLRCDRTIAGQGIEARVPFLDPEYVSTYLHIPAELRIPTETHMEKIMLRNAFDTYTCGNTDKIIEILPKSVLFRRKEAFSNGVSSIDQKETMIEGIQNWAESHNITEPLMYKHIFDNLFPNHRHIILHYWMPKWSGETSDPSATTLNIYKKLNK